MNGVAIEARIDADLAADKVLYEADDYYDSERAAAALRDMRSAAATLDKCATRLTTCLPRARFAYASQITRAKRKLSWAESTLLHLGRRS